MIEIWEFLNIIFIVEGSRAIVGIRILYQTPYIMTNMLRGLGAALADGCSVLMLLAM